MWFDVTGKRRVREATPADNRLAERFSRFATAAISDSTLPCKPWIVLSPPCGVAARALPDQRIGRNTTYAMTDFALAAFAAFFMQSPSFLAHQRHLATARGRSNCQTLFGIDKIPGDSQVRAMLNPVDPAHLFPEFADVLAILRETGGLQDMQVLRGHTLTALDGTEFHCSDKVRCPNARAVSAEARAPNISTPCWPPPSSRPATTTPCRWNQSSSHRKMATRNRVAKAARHAAG
jgi:hypothetical protein